MSHYKPYPVYKDSGVAWLDKMPGHWCTSRVAGVFRERNERGGDKSELLAVSQQHGVLPQVELMEITDRRFSASESDDWSKYRRTFVADLVYNKMRMWQGAVGCTAYDGIVSPAYVVLVPIIDISGQFFEYLFKSPTFISEAGRYSQGLCDDMNSCRYEDFKYAEIVLPPVEEQHAIVAYIDQETVRIDGLVSKKIRFIELLREKRQALITHAVTKGLDPNVQMRDSGVEWLGEVPEHWDVPSFQRCVSVAEGQVDPEVSPFREMVLLGPNHIESGSGRILFTEAASDQHAESGKYICEEGDIVYSKIRPALRKVCIAPLRCLCSADMYPLRAHSGMTNAFLFWFLLSEPFSAFAVLEADRVAMPKINRESLSKVLLPRPSIEDQSAIAAHLNHETIRIDTLITKTERSIELLKERRSALITVAVTGQIDVREYAARQDQMAA